MIIFTYKTNNYSIIMCMHMYVCIFACYVCTLNFGKLRKLRDWMLLCLCGIHQSTNLYHLLISLTSLTTSFGRPIHKRLQHANECSCITKEPATCVTSFKLQNLHMNRNYLLNSMCSVSLVCRKPKIDSSIRMKDMIRFAFLPVVFFYGLSLYAA